MSEQQSNQPPAIKSIRRVLVIDDESALRVITARLLELLDREPLVAADADEAMAHLTQRKDIDLVILDATLQASERLYDHLQRPGGGGAIPVILASGCVSQEIQDRFPDHPHELALQKPYGIEELQAMLARLEQP